MRSGRSRRPFTATVRAHAGGDGHEEVARRATTHPIPTRMLRLLLLFALAYAAFVVFAYLVVERVLFQPQPPSYAAADPDLLRIPVGEDEHVAALHLPHPDARYTILFSHGNAEDLGDARPFLRHLHGAGFGVLAYDYRGYGHSSPRRPTVRSAIVDAEAVYRHATAELGIPPERLILHGRSLGAAPTVEVAARHAVAGIVLESAFTSPYRVLTHLPLLPFDRFRNLSRLRSVRRPVLVIHGTRDAVIPFRHGRQLFAAAGEPKRALWVEGAGHNDLAYVAGERYRRALVDFAVLLEERSRRP